MGDANGIPPPWYRGSPVVTPVWRPDAAAAAIARNLNWLAAPAPVSPVTNATRSPSLRALGPALMGKP